MKTFYVRPAIDPNEYDSMPEAVTARLICNSANKKKLALINYKTIPGYKYNGFCLVLLFENNKFLTIYPGRNIVDWDVIFNNPKIGGDSFDNPVILDFSIEERIIWDWKDILDSFVNKQIVISPSDQFLFLFIRGGKEYMFNSLIDKATNQTLLFFSES